MTRRIAIRPAVPGEESLFASPSGDGPGVGPLYRTEAVDGRGSAHTVPFSVPT